MQQAAQNLQNDTQKKLLESAADRLCLTCFQSVYANLLDLLFLLVLPTKEGPDRLRCAFTHSRIHAFTHSRIHACAAKSASACSTR